MRVHNVTLHDTEGFIENLDLILNLHYEGNFRMAIEADMVLGKKGFLSVIGEWLFVQGFIYLLTSVSFVPHPPQLHSETRQWHNASSVHSQALHALVVELHR